ncbi:MAG: hypothetical protein NTU47_02730 [Ignavibacteriales bacterium]|nr:hypothetical protein [Ignavibacteriales bacterium]
MKPYSHRCRPIVAGAVLMMFALLSLSCSTDFGDNIVVTGTVAYIQLEGGFYGINGDDGRSYDPVNLPAEFRKNGMRVSFEAKELKNAASIHMWGIIVEIVHVQAL